MQTKQTTGYILMQHYPYMISQPSQLSLSSLCAGIRRVHHYRSIYGVTEYRWGLAEDYRNSHNGSVNVAQRFCSKQAHKHW